MSSVATLMSKRLSLGRRTIPYQVGQRHFFCVVVRNKLPVITSETQKGFDFFLRLRASTISDLFYVVFMKPFMPARNLGPVVQS